MRPLCPKTHDYCRQGCTKTAAGRVAHCRRRDDDSGDGASSVATALLDVSSPSLDYSVNYDASRDFDASGGVDSGSFTGGGGDFSGAGSDSSW